MSRLEHERRAPRIQIDDLRRDLRHADQELYAFHTSQRRRGTRAGRVRKSTGRTVLVIGLTGGLATAVWAALPLHRGGVTRTLHAPVHAVETAQPIAIVASDEAAAVVPSLPPPAPSIDRPHRTHAPRRAQSASAPRTSRTRPKSSESAPRPPRHPRPLSPREFGRVTTSSE